MIICFFDNGEELDIILFISKGIEANRKLLFALKNIIDDNINSKDINEKLINKYLYTADIPDPDLIIRTAGEQRISNFLPWQSVYSEYYSTKIFWPDFKPDDLLEAVKSYNTRKRKYGKL